PGIGLAAAAAAIGVLVVWIAEHPILPGTDWLLAVIAVAVALPFHVAARREGEAVGWRGVAPAAALAALGQMGLLIRVGLKAGNPEPWPMLLGILALAAMLLRQGARIATGPLQLLAAVGVAVGLLG